MDWLAVLESVRDEIAAYAERNEAPTESKMAEWVQSIDEALEEAR